MTANFGNWELSITRSNSSLYLHWPTRRGITWHLCGLFVSVLR